MIYSRVCGQHIMGSSGPVDLMMEPVFKIMDLMGVEEDERMYCMDLIQVAYHSVLRKQRDKRKKI